MILGINGYRKLYLIWIAAAWTGFGVFAPTIAQDPDYHRFADADGLWNVITNLPFVAVGVWAWRRPGARTLAAGVLLTGFGSGYYHASPSDVRLAWDRLPMTIVFMGLLGLVVENWAGWRVTGALLTFGVASVGWWAWTGDLRWYAVVQFGPVLVLAPAAVTDTGIRGLWPAGVLYAGSKVAEAFDWEIFRATGVGGHALKHLLAAGAAYWMLRWSFTCCGMGKQRGGPPLGGMTPAS